LRLYVVNYKPEDAGPVGEAIREVFPAETPPASTLVGVSSLAVTDFLIEIEAVAVVE
jgi:enamine deaminase RidA (YjgF/YER057c/UK114 family)